ncbi:MAG: hypothetical protein IMF05_04440 [Proteobacteria bacterium]|nr:hypothetical protein [Pseudomonadota bacterium]
MSELVMNENAKQTDEAADDRQPSEMHRRQRGKNIALALVLFGMAVLFYIVAIVKIGGG